MLNLATGGLVVGAAITGAGAVINALSKPTSLMSKVSDARLEPNAIIDERCLNSPYLNDVLSVATNVFIATYLQYIDLNTQYATNTDQIIKQVSVSNSIKGHSSTIGGIAASLLSIEGEDGQASLTDGIVQDIVEKDDTQYESSLPGKEFFSQESVINQKLIEGINDGPQLAIGRIVEIPIPSQDADGKPRKLRMAVRLLSTIADTQVLKDSLESRFKGNETALERKWGWKSGRLSFISDLLFGSDAIRTHRRRLMRDTDGIYNKLSPSKARDRSLGDIARGKFSVAEASSVLVIDQETADEVEYSMGGRFKDRGFRDRLIEATGIMTIAIIDRGDDMVTFYYDAIADGTKLNSSALKNAGKKDGPDVNKILEYFLASNAPRY